LVQSSGNPSAASSTGKYILYAVGEIVLVVVGILIALQINNWREAQRNNTWETYYLNRIKEDLQNDLREYEVTSSNSRSRIYLGNLLLIELGENYLEDYLGTLMGNQKRFVEQLEVDSLKLKALRLEQKIRSLAYSRSNTARSFTYNELLTSGRFEILKDDLLRETISDYYWKVEDGSKLEEDLYSCLRDYIDYLKSENLATYNPNMNSDFTELIQNKEQFKVVLKNLINEHIRVRTIQENMLKSNAQKTLDLVEVYLESK